MSKPCNIFTIKPPEPGCNKVKPGEETIEHTDFKKHYPNIHKSFAWCDIMPLIRQAQDKFITPYLCKEVICCIAQYNDIEDPEDWQICVLQYLKDALAYYTIYHGYAILNTSISGLGIQQKNDSEGTSTSAPVWAFKNSRGYICNCADSYLDKLINYILDLPEDNELRAKFCDSLCFKKNSCCWFLDMCDFEEHVSLQGSFRTFKELRPHIKKALRLYLAPILCNDILDAICKGLKNDTFENECYPELLEYIRPALAYWTMYEALPKLRVNIESNSITLISSSDGYTMKKDAHDAAVKELRCDYERLATKCCEYLLNYLCSNPDKYPLWTYSPCCTIEKEDDDTPCSKNINRCNDSSNGCGAVLIC